MMGDALPCLRLRQPARPPWGRGERSASKPGPRPDQSAKFSKRPSRRDKAESLVFFYLTPTRQTDKPASMHILFLLFCFIVFAVAVEWLFGALAHVFNKLDWRTDRERFAPYSGHTARNWYRPKKHLDQK
jgi:hypothetical protein